MKHGTRTNEEPIKDYIEGSGTVWAYTSMEPTQLTRQALAWNHRSKGIAEKQEIFIENEWGKSDKKSMQKCKRAVGEGRRPKLRWKERVKGDLKRAGANERVQ